MSEAEVQERTPEEAREFVLAWIAEFARGADDFLMEITPETQDDGTVLVVERRFIAIKKCREVFFSAPPRLPDQTSDNHSPTP